jgi:hypothetical protein
MTRCVGLLPISLEAFSVSGQVLIVCVAAKFSRRTRASDFVALCLPGFLP